MWNEPKTPYFNLKYSNSSLDKAREYTNLLKSAYKAAKLANPDAVIIGGVATGNPLTKWVEEIFKQGAFDYFDIFSFHRYTDGFPGDSSSPPTKNLVKEIKNLMTKHGNGETKPIWETESGILGSPTSYKNILEPKTGYFLGPKMAPSYFVRNMAHLLASGVEKWFYFGLFDPNVINFRHYRGAASIFEWDGAPRPLAVAYAFMAWLLSDASFNSAYLHENGISVVKFQRKDKEISVIWSNEGDGVFLKEPSRSNIDLAIYTIMGTRVDPKKNSSGQLVVQLKKDPVYFVERLR